MVLLSLELGGRLHLPTAPYMRLSWKIPVLAILAVLFVVPHDPSSRVQHVGSSGFRISSPISGLRSRFAGRRSTERTPAPPAPASRATPAPTLLLGFAAMQPQTFQEQLEKELRDQMRQMRVARWRAQRLLSTTAAWNSWSSADDGANPSAADLSPLECSGCNASYYVATSVDELRSVYGSRQRWYGDLDWVGTRELYHSLLPTHLIDDEALPLAKRARLAVSARRAARLYARERALFPLSKFSNLYDGLRVLMDHGTFQPEGLSEQQIFGKYAELLGVDAPLWDAPDGSAEEEEEYAEFYRTVLQKSCSTNVKVDEVTNVLSGGVAVGSFSAEALHAPLRSGADSLAQIFQPLSEHLSP